MGNSLAPAGESTWEWISYGGLTFTIEYNLGARRATVLNRQISLVDTNVVLVDHVDGPEGPKIVSTLHVDPTSRGAPTFDPVPYVLGRNPELMEFLQCDTIVADPAAQAMVTALCRQLIVRE